MTTRFEPSMMPQGLHLRPVLGVMVAGHRQQRLQQNWLGTEDQREAALKAHLCRALLQISDVAREAFKQGAEYYADEPCEFKLITGDATGIDQYATTLAPSAGYSLTMFSAEASSCEDSATFAHVSLGVQSMSPDPSLSQQEYSLRDNLALSFADLLLAVWDTQEPTVIASGTAAVIRTALSRRKPVLLLKLNPQTDSPEWLINQPSLMTDADLLELDTLCCDSDFLLKYFSLVTSDQHLKVALQAWMQLLLLPFQDRNPSNTQNQCLSAVMAQPSFFGFMFQWLQFFIFSNHPKPMGLLSWLWGAKRWLQVMLNPPVLSPTRRLQALLTHNLDSLSLKERLVGRIHLFCSAIARLSYTDLKTSLKLSRSSPSAYAQNRPPDDLQVIQEPDIINAFRWAEAEANCFGRRHRDGIWMIYYAAAFAVFCAVAGALTLWPATMPGLLMIWALCEFILLRFIVGHVLQARFRDWHGRWMSYRYLAEQLRYLRVGYALLVLPQAFIRPYWCPNRRNGRGELISAENWLLQRVLIATGLPVSQTTPKRYCLAEQNRTMANHLLQVLEEHREYFSRSHHQLHRDHVYLHRLAFALFFITFLAVSLHFFVKISWILIFTAFFPAWGAAIHGILSHNEVVRMSSLAGQVSGQLGVLYQACKRYQKSQEGRAESVTYSAWRETQELRALFAALTRILSDENQQWRSFNRHHQTDLPA